MVKHKAILLLTAPGLLLAGWVAHIVYLTSHLNRACGEASFMTQAEEAPESVAELQGVLEGYSARAGGVGLQATVIYPDGTVWSGASGYASQEERCPLTLDHHLYIGSITKLYTAALVIEEVERGKISLDDTLDEWFDLPYAKQVSVRMLLNHTSGVPDYTRDNWFRLRYVGLPGKHWQPEELYRVIRKQALDFTPGSEHEYSNSNYLLLGLILEAVTGKPYEGVLRESLLEKLNLQNTYFGAISNDLAIANGYDEALLPLGRKNVTGWRRSVVTGAYSAGGILSTAEDVARFVHALFTGQILSEASLDMMETLVETPEQGEPQQIGYGLGVRKWVLGGQELIGHTGTILGYSGVAMHDKAKGTTIVVLGNLSKIEQAKLLEDILEVGLRGSD